MESCGVDRGDLGINGLDELPGSFPDLWKQAATCKRYRRADGSAVFAWINQKGEHSPFSCRSWRCPDCRPGLAKFLKYRVGNWAENYDLRRFWTFTLSRGEDGFLQAEKVQRFAILDHDEQMQVEKSYRDILIMTRGNADVSFSVSGELAYTLRLARAKRIIEETKKRVQTGQLLHPSVMLYRQLANRYLSYVWNKWRTSAMRKFGKFSYIRMTEYHKDAIHPHIHCMVSSWLPIEYVRRTWDSYGGGEQVYVEYVEEENIKRVSAYVAKYISKAGEQPAEYWTPNTRHITTSRDIKLKLTPSQYETISNTEEQEGVKCPHGFSTVQLASEQFAKCYRCVFRKHCGVALPHKWKLYQGRTCLSINPQQLIDREYHRQDIFRQKLGLKPNKLEYWSIPDEKPYGLNE